MLIQRTRSYRGGGPTAQTAALTINTPPAQLRSRLVATFAFFVIMVSFLDTMAQLPVLPQFVQSLGAGARLVGIVLAAYSIANMAGNISAGLVIDRFGRKTGIVIGMAVAGSAVAFYAAVTSPQQLLFLRVLHGLGGAILVPAAFAFAGDASREENAGRSMGRAGAAVALAAMLGPAAGGIFRATFGPRPLFLTLAALMAITATLVIFFLPESYREVRRDTLPIPFSQRLRPIIRDRRLLFVFVAILFVQMAMGTLSFALPLAVDAAGFSAARTGSLFSIFALVAITLFLAPAAGLSDRYGRPVLIRMGMIALTASLAILSLGNSLPVMAGAMVVYGVGYGLAFPAMCATVVDRTDRTNRGTGFGVFYAVFSLGVAAGPVASGALVEAGVSPTAVIAVALAMAQLILFAVGRKPGPDKDAV